MKERFYDQLIFMLLCLIGGISFIFMSCSDDKDDGDTAFNASKPVEVTDFLPKSGGAGSRIIIYGSNFGNDTSKISVTIGGIKSKVINVKNNVLLCMVPSKAFSGEIRVTVLDENGHEVGSGECAEKFDYSRKWFVTTFIGQMYDNHTKYDVKDGPFGDCGGFERILNMQFDPQDHDKLFLVGYDKSFRIVDFKNQYVSTFTTNIDKVSDITWTLDGDLVLSRDHTSDTSTGLYLYTRESNFQNRQELYNARGVRGISTHPINGRIYYTRYAAGECDSYNVETGEFHKECNLPRTRTAVLITWHPTGKYCYFTLLERHTIWRSDYDPVKDELSQPYLICGKDNTTGWADGVGASVRLNKPLQGTFVKNPDYAGQDDEYDFYFCDNTNHCIRVLTPTGRVYTYAGRADTDGTGVRGYRDGDLRTEAKFYYPEGLVYDTQRNCFFIGDTNNRCIRKIAPEE